MKVLYRFGKPVAKVLNHKIPDNYQSWDEATWLNYRKDEYLPFVISRAIEAVLRKSRFEKELREFCILKYFLQGDEVDVVVNRLQDLNYINDEQLKQDISHRLENQGRGPRFISQKLALRGQKYTRNEDSPELEIALSNKHLSYIRRMKFKDLYERKSKLYRYFASQGFLPDQIQELIKLVDLKD